MKRFLVSVAAGCLLPIAAVTAQSQGLEVGELSQAQAFEPGALSAGSGALSSGLWTGTNAGTAEVLINDLPDHYSSPVARDLARRVLLSPGSPPSGDMDGSYQVTRMNGIIRLSELAAAQDIAARSPGLASSEFLKVDLALLAGDMESACQKSDSIIEGRSDPYWMKLRALCHVKRGEKAAADVTLDLLKNSGDKDIYFERLLRHLTGIPGTPDLANMPASPVYIAMMGQAGLDWPDGQKPAASAAQAVFNVAADPDTRLAALMVAGPALSDSQIREVIESFNPGANDPETSLNGLAGGVGGVPSEPGLDVALADTGAKGFFQLYTLAQTGSSETRMRALIALLKRAEASNGFDRFAELMTQQLQIVDYNSVLASDLPLLSRAAILRRDIGALQQIYQALDGNAQAQDRVALAADALGNGFFGGNLGTDIDGRLSKPDQRPRALRDAMLAYGLGANLSEAALKAMSDKAVLGRVTGDLFAFEVASQNRAVAETALRAAKLIEDNETPSDFTLYKIVDGLYKAGLTDEAARLAALDFIQGMPE